MITHDIGTSSEEEVLDSNKEYLMTVDTAAPRRILKWAT